MYQGRRQDTDHQPDEGICGSREERIEKVAPEQFESVPETSYADEEDEKQDEDCKCLAKRKGRAGVLGCGHESREPLVPARLPALNEKRSPGEPFLAGSILHVTEKVVTFKLQGFLGEHREQIGDLGSRRLVPFEVQESWVEKARGVETLHGRGNILKHVRMLLLDLVEERS